MNTPTRKHLKPWLVPVALLLVVSSLFVARTVVAKISMNTIDTVGLVTDHGRHGTVTGPIAVTEGERTELRVTVTQRSTGVVAEGVIFFTGTGQTNHWELTAGSRGIRGRPRHRGRTRAQFHQRPRH
jgi:hypothetical protein